MHGNKFQAKVDSYDLGQRIPIDCHLEHVEVIQRFTQGMVKKEAIATIHNTERVGNNFHT